MVVLIARPGPTDDEKSRLSQAAIDEAQRLLNDPYFSITLSETERKKLKALIAYAQSDLALYRGVLKRQGTGSGALGVVATSTTGEPLSSGAMAVIFLCTAAIGLIVLNTTSEKARIESQLDRSLQSMGDTLHSIVTSTTIMALTYAPRLSASNLQYLTSLGVIVVAGTVMAVNVQKLSDLVKSFQEQVEANMTAEGRMRCTDEYLKFTSKTEELLEALKAPRPADVLGQKRQEKGVMTLFREWQEAANRLFACLGMDLPF